MLKKAKDSFADAKAPPIETTKFTSGGVYILWEFFTHNIEVINSDRTFSGVRLMMIQL